MVKKFCENVCFMEPDCVSINLNKRADGNGKYRCELNNVTHEGHEDELKEEENYFYHAAEASNASMVMISVFIFAFRFLGETSVFLRARSFGTIPE